MANNAIQWETAEAVGNVLSTELNSLSNGSRTNAGTEYDNSTSKKTHAWVEFACTWGSAPAAGGYVQVHLVRAPDGTNYEDGSSSVDPGAHTVVVVIPVRATTSAQRLVSRPFRLPPFKVKPILYNGSGQAMPASGSTLKLHTSRLEVE